MKKLQTIELFIKDEQKDGAFAISLVENPAIEDDFVLLSADGESRFHFEGKAVDDERRIVVGFALIPDKDIYRSMKGKEFNIRFSKETVSKAANLYMKNHNQSNVTSEHKRPVKDCYVMETWTVEDPKNDKSNIYGLEPKGGEWAVMMKLDNPEEYAKAKAGQYKGFSIEGIFDGFDQLEASKVMTEQERIDEILKIIG